LGGPGNRLTLSTQIAASGQAGLYVAVAVVLDVVLLFHSASQQLLGALYPGFESRVGKAPFQREPNLRHPLQLRFFKGSLILLRKPFYFFLDTLRNALLGPALLRDKWNRRRYSTPLSIPVKIKNLIPRHPKNPTGQFALVFQLVTVQVKLDKDILNDILG
jgi:hypothetical protein